MLRPETIKAGQPRPQAAVVVRYPGLPPLRELVLRGLLRRGWSLVAPPVGEYEFGPGPRARVYISAGQVRIVANGETIFDGELRLTANPAGESWSELAQLRGEVLTCITVGDKPILTEEDVERAARQGYLVGVVGDVR